MGAMRQRVMTVAVAVTCSVLGLLSSQCTRPPVASILPPFDQCCACLATHSTPRGARCSRGTIAECINDIEKGDVSGMETNIRCIRDVCGDECALFSSQLPSAESVEQCCQCLAEGTSPEGSDCYGGTTEQCTDEIEEGEINGLLQGAGLCLQSTCGSQCAALFGAPPDAGQPDAAGPEDAGSSSSSMGSSSSGGVVTRQDGGPHLPWDGGCPGPFPCF